MAVTNYRKIASLKTVEGFRSYIDKQRISIPFDEQLESGPGSALNQPVQIEGKTVGNKFCALPMEGWDGTKEGLPTELTKRRWRNFGSSGCKLIWGGEACAVCHEGKANPRQLVINEQTVSGITNLLEVLKKSHEQIYRSDDLLVGLQLTHSGRFCRPNDNKVAEPKILYHHPILDKRVGVTKTDPCLNDEEVSKIIQQFINSALLARQAGFDFVDIKHCHGYLGHEFLSAYTREGPYGGSFENRTRFLKEIVSGIRERTKTLMIGVRISVFDFVPFEKNDKGIGRPAAFDGDYPFAFGGDSTGLGIDLTETVKLLDLLSDMGINLVCATAGSPYYNPHIQRPAMYPPSDGYLPPEDPLAGVSRLINAGAELKQKRPEMIIVGSGYTYLQEWIPHVAQCIIHSGLADFVGLGRMMLAYPQIVDDILSGKPLDKKRICRTFSDCTTAPRQGLVSGCYALDNFYKNLPEAKNIKKLKKNTKEFLTK